MTPATVVGGDAAKRRRIAEMLREAGFSVHESDQRLPGVPASLVVLIAPGDDPTRGRAIRELVEAAPEAPVLVVVRAGVPNGSLKRALLAGASGIISEEDVAVALIASARAVLAGQLAVPVALGRTIAPRPLSHREKQILRCVVAGLTNREIANRLYLAESTVKTHLASAFRKLDARSRAEAVARIQDPESGFGAGVLALPEVVAANGV